MNRLANLLACPCLFSFALFLHFRLRGRQTAATARSSHGNRSLEGCYCFGTVGTI